MNRGARIFALAIAVIVVAASGAHAGWVLSEEDGQETVISKGKMKSIWENGAVIFDGEANTVHFIDDSRKMIASGTVDEICDGINEMVESMLESVPAEQREMMKKMMGDGKMPTVEIVEKGDGEKIAGFATKRYNVMADGELYEELWLANDKALMADCEAVMKMLGEFTSCTESISSMGSAPSAEASPEYTKIFGMGMIVKSVGHHEDETGNPDGISEIAKKDIPDATFELPNGYKAASFAEIFGMPGH